METVAVRPESRRGRKRKRNNVQNVMMQTGGRKKVVESRPFRLVGRYVRREFQGCEVLLGRIMLYDSGLYKIIYEDRHSEDLISSNVKVFLVEDGDLTGEWADRKEKLNELLSSKGVNTKDMRRDDTLEMDDSDPIDSPLLNEMTNGDSVNDETVEVHNGGNGDVDADSLSCSYEGTQEGEPNLDMEVPLVPPPELPPSSGNIGVPKEYISHLLSVFSFLRSFSVRLFLYPFRLDDFVGALNCSVTNTLLDSVHVALMRVLKRHFDRLSPDGSELVSKMLGYLDWSLLDMLTWPIYLVHYLIVMGYKNGDDWNEFYTHCLEREYYTLPSGKKLIVLQILCEDVLGTEEIRAEMDMRVESEVGTDIDIDISSTVGTLCEPERVHSGYSGTSACKDVDAAEGVEKHLVTKFNLGYHYLESQVDREVGNSIHEDGNGDECRLCGMDGLLICCDGCPSCYHSRCLGISKMFMPDGSWYCPECKINAREPKILRGTALRGGDIFGVDPYKQVYLASCDHLLVLKASLKFDDGLRYYNRHDIPGVIHSLSSIEGHAIMYSEICRGIMKYWELSPDILPCNRISNKVGSGQCSTQLVNFLDKVPEMTEVENHGSGVAGSCADLAASQITSCVKIAVSSEHSLDAVILSDQHIDSMGQQCEIMKTTTTEAALFCSLIGQPADPCELRQQNTSFVTETVSSRNSNAIYNGPVNGSSLEAKTRLLSQELNDSEACGSPQNWCLYMGFSFKTTAYINHYLHGDFAASAAANLAIFSCKENEVQESRSSEDQQKVTGASIALQLKAFSSAAMRFFWPNTEKKLVEVPRERCSWCFSCKAAVASKRGCLLNAAASNAIRGATKLIAGVRPVKSDEDGRLSGIGTYIMFMEESLSGLLVGPFLCDKFRIQWRKQVEQVTSCNGIKILLLELEENMRPIALSGDWMKLVEGFSSQSSTSQIVATASGSALKHRPGRRGRKHSVMAEVAVGGCRDTVKLNDFIWWRGVTLSKLMFQKGILPRSIIKKSARQGGIKKIPGIHYVEGNEIPKSSRQLVWRSAVEMSRTVAQIALQVRNLDFHVRWGDLVRSEQTLFDGKGPEAEASTFFRNAVICDKKIVENKIRYCVAFGSQKHLPSRLMKNVTEIEQTLDHGNERYWFLESHMPLYLIKEYEQKVDKHKPVHVLSKLQRRHLKTSCENIFSFLLWKQENTARKCCSCHQDVFYRNAAKCSACQGFCHKQCAPSSTVNLNRGTEFSMIKKQCCENQAGTQAESNHGSPTSPMLLQGLDFPYPATASKLGQKVGSQGSSSSLGAVEHSSEVKSTNRFAVTDKNRKSNWGLIWRKKNCVDTGIDFRLKNILLRGNADMNLMKPLCRLCNQPYNADLMYIRCDTCKHWFHADSVELDESKIFSVVGFKCCKCRRIKSPVCPYLDPMKKRVMEDKVDRQQATKLMISTMDSDRGTIPDHKNTWNFPNSIEKMPIRRRVTREANLDCCSATNSFKIEVPNLSETNAVSSVQRIASMEKIDDSSTLTSACLSSDDTEINPWTIFSLNEFLESDDGDYANGNKPPENVMENQQNSSSLAEIGTPKLPCDEERAIISTKIAPCKLCSNIERVPDLCCQICDMWIHGSCSPWIESSSNHEGDWRCGNCREWR